MPKTSSISDSIGTVTAGTYVQLETRTWAALRHWTKLCITGRWFEIQARVINHKLRPETWKIVAQTCKEGNAQSFAGQHARTSTSWYMFDEASLIPDKVWRRVKQDLAERPLTKIPGAGAPGARAPIALDRPPGKPDNPDTIGGRTAHEGTEGTRKLTEGDQNDA